MILKDNLSLSAFCMLIYVVGSPTLYRLNIKPLVAFVFNHSMMLNVEGRLNDVEFTSLAGNSI